MTTLERLAELEAAATPGPWHADDTTDGYFDGWEEEEEPPPRIGWFRDCGVGQVDTGDYKTLAYVDAALIAAIRNAAPKLLAVAEGLREVLLPASWYESPGVGWVTVLSTEHLARLRAALEALDHD